MPCGGVGEFKSGGQPPWMPTQWVQGGKAASLWGTNLPGRVTIIARNDRGFRNPRLAKKICLRSSLGNDRKAAEVSLAKKNMKIAKVLEGICRGLGRTQGI